MEAEKKKKEKGRRRKTVEANEKFNKCVRGLTIAGLVFGKLRRNAPSRNKMILLYMIQTWSRTFGKRHINLRVVLCKKRLEKVAKIRSVRHLKSLMALLQWNNSIVIPDLVCVYFTFPSFLPLFIYLFIYLAVYY